MKLNSRQRVQYRGNLIVTRDPAALEEMAKPDIMGAIWTDAWSEPALKAASDFVRDEWTPCSRSAVSRFRWPTGTRLQSPEFEKDGERVANVFERLARTLDIHGDVHDTSKFEEIATDRPLAWHQDGGQFTLVSAVAGRTTLTLDHRPAGILIDRSRSSTDFLPDDPAAVLKLAAKLRNADAFIFKNRDFSAAARVKSPIHSWPAGTGRRVVMQHFIG